MAKSWVEDVPQLLIYVTVAEHDAVGFTVCCRDVPEVPQPVHDQLPPEEGVGARITCAPELMVALAVWTPLMNGVMVVGLQVPPPPAPYEQYLGVPTLIAGNDAAEH
jgi:hypothetical protein